jgi:hypothetical protein
VPRTFVVRVGPRCGRDFPGIEEWPGRQGRPAPRDEAPHRGGASDKGRRLAASLSGVLDSPLRGRQQAAFPLCSGPPRGASSLGAGRPPPPRHPGATIPPLGGRQQAAFPPRSAPPPGASSLGAGRPPPPRHPGATIPPWRGRQQAAFPLSSDPAGGASSLGAGRPRGLLRPGYQPAPTFIGCMRGCPTSTPMTWDGSPDATIPLGAGRPRRARGLPPRAGGGGLPPRAGGGAAVLGSRAARCDGPWDGLSFLNRC